MAAEVFLLTATLLVLLVPVHGSALGGLFGAAVNIRGPPFLTKSGLSDQTEYVKLDGLDMSFLAFGDFNRDRFVDALVYDPRYPQVVRVALWDHVEYRFVLAEKELAITLPEEIASATVADFDDNGDVDVLLTVARGAMAYIFTGNGAGGFEQLESLTDLPDTDSFLVMDADGDFRPDILVARASGERGFYRSPTVASSEYKYMWEPWITGVDDPNTCLPTDPYSHAFVDIDGDCLPDLVMTTTCGLEVWLNPASVEKKFWELAVSDTYHFRKLSLGVWNPDERDGQIAFADFNGDGTIDMAVPNEEDMNVRVHLNMQNQRRYGELCVADRDWTFEMRTAVGDIKLTPQRLAKNFRVPGALRVGDFNFDGLPDFLALSSLGKIELFENIGNWKEVSSAPYFRKFAHDDALSDVDDAVAAAFIDLDESGRQDIVVVQRYGTKLIWNNYNKHADSLFFKATGLSSLSYFRHDPRPFSPLPGTTFKLSFDSPDGKVQYTCSQCPQSAFLPLQSCNCLFGLVRISNYIEEMAMGGASTSRSWANLMPNSMAIIWPDPSEGTKSWWMEYFTQQRFDQIQGVVSFLITSLMCIAIAIWYLSWQERKQDRIEQLVRATAFHI